jgi:hypothetical protein
LNPWIFWWHFWLVFWELQTRATPVLPCPPSCPIVNLARWKADHPPAPSNGDGPTRGEAA